MDSDRREDGEEQQHPNGPNKATTSHYYTDQDTRAIEPRPIGRNSIEIVESVHPALSFPDDHDGNNDIAALLSTTFGTNSPRSRASQRQHQLHTSFGDDEEEAFTMRQAELPRPSGRYDSYENENRTVPPRLPATTTEIEEAATTTQSLIMSTFDPYFHHGTAPSDSSSIRSSTNPETWNAQLQQLEQFKSVHGHCVVPLKYDTALVNWIKRQRHQYRKWQSGGHSTLTDERRQKLNELGLVWDSHDATWEQRFSELVAFKSQNSHTNVPGICPDNPPLGIWVKGQRKQYLDDMKRSIHTTHNVRAARYERLEGIGFKWTLRGESKMKSQT